MEPATFNDVILGLSADDQGFSFLEQGEERRSSFAAIGVRAREVAAALAGLGLPTKARLGLILIRQSECVDLFLGALLAGIVPIPMYPPLTAGGINEYLEHAGRIVSTASADAVIVSDELRPGMRPLEDICQVLTVRDVETAPTIERSHIVCPQDLAFLQFTSGSTSAPRGVMVTHAALLANARVIAKRLALEPARDRGVSWLPMYHDMGLIGMLAVPLLIEGSVWFLPPLEFARKPELWCDVISDVKGTISFAPNFGFSLLAKRATDSSIKRWKLDQWRIAGCGAEPVDIMTLRAFADRLAPCGFREEAILPCYGLAEATLAVTLPAPNYKLKTLTVDGDSLSRERTIAPPRKAGVVRTLVSCGPPVDEHTVTIVDSAGITLGAGHEGEIIVAGPSVASGYCGDAQGSMDVFSERGVRTGDAGVIIDGELYVTGRLNDLIIVNGRNFYPQDIEWSASKDDAVRNGGITAFGVAGDTSEKVIVVIETGYAVKQNDGMIQTVGARAVAARIAKRVRIEVGLPIAEVVIVAARGIPKTSSGKLRRAATRALFLEGELPVIERVKL